MHLLRARSGLYAFQPLPNGLVETMEGKQWPTRPSLFASLPSTFLVFRCLDRLSSLLRWMQGGRIYLLKIDYLDWKLEVRPLLSLLG